MSYLSSYRSDSSDDGDELRERMLRQPSLPIGQLLMRYRPAFTAMGLLNPAKQRLGTGSFGVAYQIEIDGIASVLKITKDPYEVLSSFALQGEEMERIVPIYNVWSCKRSLPRGKKGKAWLAWFVIHRGLLKPLSQKDTLAVDALHELHFDSEIELGIPQPGAAGRSMRDKWKMHLRETLPSQLAARAAQLFEEICVGVREMRNAGIDWSDFHGDNIMRDMDGKLRIADVGFGIPRSDDEIEPPEFSAADVGRYLKALRAAAEPTVTPSRQS